MTDQPTKAKQHLLAELESIMSVLDEDAVIPTLDTVVEPETNSPQATPTVQKPEVPAIDPMTAAVDAVSPTEPAAKPEPILSTKAEMMPKQEPPLESSGFNAEMNTEFRQAMEVEIDIPNVSVPDSQTLFGNSQEQSKQTSQEQPKEKEKTSPDDEMDLLDKVSQKFGIDTSKLIKHPKPEETTAATELKTEAKAEAQPKPQITEKPIFEQSGERQNICDSVVDAEKPVEPPGSSAQQNPFPAPNRKPHLFNGKTQAEAPLPGQQHLFDCEPDVKSEPASKSESKLELTSEPQFELMNEPAHETGIHVSSEETEKPSAESPLSDTTHTEPVQIKPDNPFKHSGKSSATSPPASLMNSFRRSEPTFAEESFQTIPEPKKDISTVLPETKAALTPSPSEPEVSDDLTTDITTDETPALAPKSPEPSLPLSEATYSMTEPQVSESAINEPVAEPSYAADHVSVEYQARRPEEPEDRLPTEPKNEPAEADPEAIVDEILDKHLPKLEAELRKRLLATMNKNLDL